MTEEQEISEYKEIHISDYLNSAETKFTNEPGYSNHIRFNTSANELIIDFYQILPDRSVPGEIEIYLIQRIIAPLNHAKGFVEGLANHILKMEKALNMKLPLERDKADSDIVEVWKLIGEKLAKD